MCRIYQKGAISPVATMAGGMWRAIVHVITGSRGVLETWGRRRIAHTCTHCLTHLRCATAGYDEPYSSVPHMVQAKPELSRASPKKCLGLGFSTVSASGSKEASC